MHSGFILNNYKQMCVLDTPIVSWIPKVPKTHPIWFQPTSLVLPPTTLLAFFFNVLPVICTYFTLYQMSLSLPLKRNSGPFFKNVLKCHLFFPGLSDGCVYPLLVLTALLLLLLLGSDPISVCSLTRKCTALGCCCLVMSDSGTPGTAAHQAPLSFTVSRVCSDPCPFSQWCYLTISFSAALFSFYLQSFPASGSFPMSWLFSSGSQSIGALASAIVLAINIQLISFRIDCFDLLEDRAIYYLSLYFQCISQCLVCIKLYIATIKLCYKSPQNSMD